MTGCGTRPAGRSSAVIWSLTPSASACSITFSSSRTLPGQSCRHEPGQRVRLDSRRRAGPSAARACGRSTRRAAGCPPALAQRRQHERDDVQPVEEILAERAGPGRRLQVAVRRGNQPEVHPHRPRAADALELPLLQRAQQLRLQRERQLADLVEEERAAVGQLHLALLEADRAGERPLLVAEQLRSREVFRSAPRS